MPQKKAKDPKTGLTVSEEAFCQAMLRNNRHLSAAYRASFDCTGVKATSINSRAYALSVKPQIQMRIDELVRETTKTAEREYGVTAERVLAEIAHVALSDVGSLFTADGRLRDINDLTAAERACIASIEVVDEHDGKDAEGQATFVKVRKIRLWNKNDSLEKLARHLGLYREDNLQKQGLFDGLEKDDLTELRAFLTALRARKAEGEGGKRLLQ